MVRRMACNLPLNVTCHAVAAVSGISHRWHFSLDTNVVSAIQMLHETALYKFIVDTDICITEEEQEDSA